MDEKQISTQATAISEPASANDQIWGDLIKWGRVLDRMRIYRTPVTPESKKTKLWGKYVNSFNAINFHKLFCEGTHCVCD